MQTIIASTTKVDSAEQINDKQITFHKRGRALTGGYDITRRQRLDLFSVVLRQIGSHIVYSHLVDAVRLLIYGDCGCEAAEVTEVTPENWFNSTSGVVLKFQTKLTPYEMNTMLVSDDIALKLFQNLQPQLSFQHQGCAVTQFGTTMIRSHALPERAAIGLDNRFALEMVQIRDIETDYSALIDRHFERASISTISGFSKIYTDASRVLKIV